MNGEVRRYLRRATRGVHGRQRQAIQAELHGHIEARTNELVIGGLDEVTATLETLRELGAPAGIAGGMAQVHSLPPLVRGSLGLALAATMLLTVVPHGLAQVQVFDKNMPYLPTVAPYLSVNSLLHELRQTGSRASLEGQNLSIGLAGKIDVNIPVQIGHRATYGEDEFVRRGREVFMRSDVLTSAAARSGLPVTLNGLHNPTLHWGETVLGLGTAAQPYDAGVLQVNRLQAALGTKLRNIGSWTDDPTVSVSHTVQAPARPGEVLALAVVYTLHTVGFSVITSKGYTPPPAYLLIKVAQADAQGRVRFALPVARLSFTGTDPKRLDLSRPVPEGQPSPAVLLRLNPRLDPAGGPVYTVIPADQVKALR